LVFSLVSWCPASRTPSARGSCYRCGARPGVPKCAWARRAERL